MRWRGDVGPGLIAHLVGRAGARTGPRPARRATRRRGRSTVLGFDDGTVAAASATCNAASAMLCATRTPTRRRRDDAAQRIAELTEARRILLTSATMAKPTGHSSSRPAPGGSAEHPSLLAIEKARRAAAGDPPRLPLPAAGRRAPDRAPKC